MPKKDRAPSQLGLQLVGGVEISVELGLPFNERLRALMRAALLTNIRLAKSLGVGKTTVDRWLSGETPMRAADIAPICHLLGVTPNELIGLGENDVRPRLTRREDEYLKMLTHGGQLDSARIREMAMAIKRLSKGISTLELFLNSVAEVVARLEQLKQEGCYDFSSI